MVWDVGIIGSDVSDPPLTSIPEWMSCPFEEYVSDPIIPLEYTKINTIVKVGVSYEESRKKHIPTGDVSRSPPPGLPAIVRCSTPVPSRFGQKRSRKSQPRFLKIPANHSRISLRKFYSAKPISFCDFIHYVKGKPGQRARPDKNRKRKIPEEQFCSFKRRGLQAPIRIGRSHRAPFSAQTGL